MKENVIYMTKSECISLANPTRCPQSSYNGTFQSSYLTAILKQNSTVAADDRIFLDNTFRKNGNVKCEVSSNMDQFSSNVCSEEMNISGYPQVISSMQDDVKKKFVTLEVPKEEFENELTDLLEQLEVDDDAIYEQSQPLKIDPNVLRLDFSKLLIRGNYETLDELCFNNFSGIQRTSHHLSGGGLLNETSQDNFQNMANGVSKICVPDSLGESEAPAPTKSVFNFESLSDFNLSSGGDSKFFNQMSPSSPLTFDLTEIQDDQSKTVTNKVSYEAESTNPFKNLIKQSLVDENSFSPTNPFNDFVIASSLSEKSSIICVPPRYENILPQKSFSQCSTRTASPVLKHSEELSVMNPFLINETSQKSNSPPPSPSMSHISENKSKFHSSVTALPNSNSFIFAVPVFPILQQKIADFGTQTVDVKEITKSEEPIYQNLTNQLRKLMNRDDHSEYDLQSLKTTIKDLKTSGWYYENVSWQESVVLLANTKPGTFLIRDSSDPNFLFSLSVQTSRGPTSVRIHYVNGQFRLDAEKKLIPYMPSFNSVIELIDYYVENTKKNNHSEKTNKLGKKSGKPKLQKSKDQVWIDSQGNIYSNILLVKPLYKRDHFSTLQHLTRLTINNCLKRRFNLKLKFNFRVTPVYESFPFQDVPLQSHFDNFCPILSIDALPLPSKLQSYLKEYPYCH